jgi:hypothetical protein
MSDTGPDPRELAQSAFDAFRGGEHETLLATMSEDIVWHVVFGGGSDDIILSGKANVGAFLDTGWRNAATGDTFQVGQPAIDGFGSQVIVRVKASATIDDAAWEDDVVLVGRTGDAGIEEVWQFFEDPAGWLDFWSVADLDVIQVRITIQGGQPRAVSPGGVITRALMAWSNWEASNDAATRAALRTMIAQNATWYGAAASYQGIDAVLHYLDRPERLKHIAGMQVANATTPTRDPNGNYVIRYGLYSAADPTQDTVTLTVTLSAAGTMLEVRQQSGNPSRWATE